MLFLVSPYVTVFGFTNHSHYEKKTKPVHVINPVNEQVSSIVTISSTAL